jgi:hypothetical protein
VFGWVVAFIILESGDWYVPGNFIMAAMIGGVSGGLVQFTILRSHTQYAKWWIPASVIEWAIFAAVYGGVFTFFRNIPGGNFTFTGLFGLLIAVIHQILTRQQIEWTSRRIIFFSIIWIVVGIGLTFVGMIPIGWLTGVVLMRLFHMVEKPS